MQRIRRGQNLETILHASTSTKPNLQAIDSPFQLQEYLALLIRQDPHNVERIVALPQPTLWQDHASSQLPSASGGGGGNNNAPAGEEDTSQVDTDVWVYEQLRRIVLDFSSPWLTVLQRECDRASRPTCAAMNAEDWMYLCASHGEEKQCCAIDYTIHTLDGTTALLNSARHFPARTYIPTTSLRHFGSTSRRLSRIFVHAYEHHRDVFEACEAETSLYARFLALVEAYDLIDTESLPKLPRASGSGNTVAGVDTPDATSTPTTSSSAAAADAHAKARAGAANGSARPEERARSPPPPPAAAVRILSRPGKEKAGGVEGGAEGVGGGTTTTTAAAAATSLGRSDSVASRVTAVRIEPPVARRDDDEAGEEEGVEARRREEEEGLAEEVGERDDDDVEGRGGGGGDWGGKDTGAGNADAVGAASASSRPESKEGE